MNKTDNDPNSWLKAHNDAAWDGAHDQVRPGRSYLYDVYVKHFRERAAAAKAGEQPTIAGAFRLILALAAIPVVLALVIGVFIAVVAFPSFVGEAVRSMDWVRAYYAIIDDPRLISEPTHGLLVSWLGLSTPSLDVVTDIVTAAYVCLAVGALIVTVTAVHGLVRGRRRRLEWIRLSVVLTVLIGPLLVAMVGYSVALLLA